MKILLPPSEGKTPASSGAPLDLTALSTPELARQRTRVINVLKRVSKKRDALAVLGVGASLVDDVARNVEIDSHPSTPALETYSGVLYEAMGATELVAQSRTNPSLEQRLRDVHIFSALFGQVSALDEIPAYRLAMKTKLPGLGKLTSWWKPHLNKTLTPPDTELLLDCRSSDYRAAWPGPVSQVVTLGAVQVVGDKRKVVSHWAKYYRGEIVGRLLRDQREMPATKVDLVERLAEHYTIEFAEAAGRHPANVMVVLKDLSESRQ